LRHLTVLLAAIAVALVGAAGADAANRSWIGGPTGAWNTGTNWSPSGVPQPGDVAYTGGSGQGRVITISGTSASVAAVYGGAALVVDGVTLTLTGGLAPTTIESADVVGGGAVQATGAGTL
jgi:hypothetical protein